MPKRPTLTLTPHPTAGWMKRIDGKLYYFGGAGSTEDQAREELLAFLQRRAAGVLSVALRRKPWTLNEIASLYDAACEHRVYAQHPSLQYDTWQEYRRVINDVLAILGPATAVESLSPERFREVMGAWAGLGKVRLRNQVQVIRTMFRWAGPEGEHLIELPRYGKVFVGPREAEIGTEAYLHRKEHGERPFTPAELTVILDKATGRWRLWVLLGLNGGMYSVDISDLRRGDLRVDGQVVLIDTLRRKTAVPRLTPLWKETWELLEPYVKRVKEDDERLFRTIHGNPFNNRKTGSDSIGKGFGKLLAAWGLPRRKGVGFGSFRHVHTTAANSIPDEDARVMVRGHQIEGIDKHYSFPPVSRLTAVTDAVYELVMKTAAGPVPAAPASRHSAALAGGSDRSPAGGSPG